ncbi:SPIR [Acanthosepion pharaonis]|uniref:SPIR n=1 Tax=Acanthosepion pharaonis TaxID=158019 RepID=A0A812E160_ACAPH|nr:SPIR [Sepia pharaonis]
MKTLPPRSPDPHEKLLIEIRSQPKLRPIKEGKVLVETSRTKLNLDDDDESPLPVRKVIKPDFNLILDNSFEAEDDDSSSRDGTDDERKESYKRPANRENSTDRNAKLVRRHTIMVCESPTEAKVVNLPGPDSLHTVSEVEELFNSIMEVKNNNSKENLSKMDNDSPTTPTTITPTPPPAAAAAAAAAASGEKANTQDLNASKLMHKKWQNPIECLSLTLDEVMHIRQVLTKAEIESLITQPQLYDLVSRGKLCFSCKSVKFSLFSQWGNNCRFCKRVVCNKCIRKSKLFHHLFSHTLSSPPSSSLFSSFFLSRSPLPLSRSPLPLSLPSSSLAPLFLSRSPLPLSPSSSLPPLSLPPSLSPSHPSSLIPPSLSLPLSLPLSSLPLSPPSLSPLSLLSPSPSSLSPPSLSLPSLSSPHHPHLLNKL